MRYLLDSNSYIQAKNQYYQIDFCPGYWDWLDHQFEAGILASILLVYKELESFDDELSVWVKSRKKQFLDVSDDKTQEQFIQIAAYSQTLQNMQPGNIENFLAGADPWLIAKASVLNAVIVTQEVLAPESARKIKIPNVCKKFGVQYMNTFQLLRELEACFIMKVNES